MDLKEYLVKREEKVHQVMLVEMAYLEQKDPKEKMVMKACLDVKERQDHLEDMIQTLMKSAVAQLDHKEKSAHLEISVFREFQEMSAGEESMVTP